VHLPGSDGISARAAPPAPITQTEEPSIPATISRSVLNPTILPPSKTRVLTELPSASSQRDATACL
jgi:hypothetical protein